MLYLKNTTDSQVLFVPRNGFGLEAEGELKLTIKSTICLDVKVDVEVVDLATSETYFNLALTLPEGMDNGEYEYVLTRGGVEMSSGILILSFDPAFEQTDKSIEYEQYTIR